MVQTRSGSRRDSLRNSVPFNCGAFLPFEFSHQRTSAVACCCEGDHRRIGAFVFRSANERQLWTSEQGVVARDLDACSLGRTDRPVHRFRACRGQGTHDFISRQEINPYRFVAQWLSCGFRAVMQPYPSLMRLQRPPSRSSLVVIIYITGGVQGLWHAETALSLMFAVHSVADVNRFYSAQH